MSEAARVTSGVEAVEAPARRIDAIDVLRGLAIVAMVAYHATWDLGYYKLLPYDLAGSQTGRLVAKGIAGSFLFLVGIGLVLAHRRGVRWRPFLRRLALVAGSALLVSVATLLVFPLSFVYFGILHMIALGSVLALPFVFAPPVVTALAAIVFLAGPRLFASPAFDGPWLLWLGLGTRFPSTQDYEPVFPWLGVILAGIVVARLAWPALQRLGEAWQARRGLGWLLAAAGRWSLLIYLVHQPILLGLLYPIATIAGPHPSAESAPFRATCERTCVDAGTGIDLCRRTCECVATEMKERGLWARTELSEEEYATLRRVPQQCFLRSARPPS